MTRQSWIAGPDRLAHASRPGDPRALCGRVSLDPRWGWPERGRCPDCQARALAPSASSRRGELPRGTMVRP